MSFDETAFHRKLIFAAEDDRLTAAWLDVHHEHRQGSIALRTIDLTPGRALLQGPVRTPYYEQSLAELLSMW